MLKTTNRNNQFRQRPKPGDNTSFLFFCADIMRQQPSVFLNNSWQQGRLSKLCALIDEHRKHEDEEIEASLEHELRWIENILDLDTDLKRALLQNYEAHQILDSE